LRKDLKSLSFIYGEAFQEETEVVLYREIF